MIELLRNVRWHLRKDFENSLSGFSLKRYRASLLMAIQDVTDELYKHEEHERHWCGGEFENERYIHPYQNWHLVKYYKKLGKWPGLIGLKKWLPCLKIVICVRLHILKVLLLIGCFILVFSWSFLIQLLKKLNYQK